MLQVSPLVLSVAIAAVLSLCRAGAAPGDLDTSFHGTGAMSISEGPRVAVSQKDGKLLYAYYGGIRRLLPDGSADYGFGRQGFAAVPSGTGTFGGGIAVQSDGKILVSGIRRSDPENEVTLARVLPDGTPDSSFGGGEGYVSTRPAFYNQGGNRIAVQKDGRILVALAPGGLVRYLPDGTLDAGFGNGGFATDILPGGVTCLRLQDDGKILFAGKVWGLGAGRLNADGTLDTAFGTEGVFSHFFFPGGLATVNWLEVLSDGRILVAGSYEGRTAGDPPRGVVARILPGGILDTTFNGKGWNDFVIPGSFSNTVVQLLPQSDGRIVLAGSAVFQAVEPGSEREIILPDGVRLGFFSYYYKGGTLLARVQPDGQWDTAFGNGGLAYHDTGDLLARCAFAGFQPDGKIQMWSNLSSHDVGQGGFITRYESGFYSGINIEQSDGGMIAPGGAKAVDFGIVTLGSRTKEFTIKNFGAVPLNGIAVSVTGGGADPSEYLCSQPPVSLAPGMEARFLVTFAPRISGERPAVLDIVSDDPFYNPLSFSLTGRLATNLEIWRVTYFGSTENSGPGADLSDFDHDGLPNLLEFATGSHPHQLSAPPGRVERKEGTLEYTYSRAESAVGELTWQLESAPDPAGPWSVEDAATEAVTDEGAMQIMRLSIPATGARLFVRLRIARRY